ISYNIKGSPMNNAQIKIYNVLGQLVDTIQGENGEATWNPGTAPNGIYFYKVSSDDFTSVKKMILMR
ncbi:T9SS C-terminal target domain-containing protein, partial [bacterium]